MLPASLMAARGGGYPAASAGPRSRTPPAMTDGMDAVTMVEAATAETLHGQTDWQINTNLCDLLTHAPGETVAVMEILKKKLRSKSHAVGLTAVVLLETLVRIRSEHGDTSSSSSSGECCRCGAQLLSCSSSV